MDVIGDDVIVHALAYLQAHELARLASTTKRLNTIVSPTTVVRAAAARLAACE